MFDLGDRHKEIIRNYPIDGGLDKFCKKYSEFVLKIPSKPSFKEIATSATTDPGIFL